MHHPPWTNQFSLLKRKFESESPRQMLFEKYLLRQKNFGEVPTSEAGSRKLETRSPKLEARNQKNPKLRARAQTHTHTHTRTHTDRPDVLISVVNPF